MYILFTHDLENKQWKEIGVGELKILRHRETKRCRILMRREKVAKLCMYDFITKDIILSPAMSSDRAWRWFPQDFSNGKESNELAVKFETIQISKQFKEVFEKCQNGSYSVAPSSEVEEVVKYPEQPCQVDLLKSDAEKKEGASKPVATTIPSEFRQTAVDSSATLKTGSEFQKPAGNLFDKFKPKTGSWECTGCYVVNPAETTVCPACQTPKPGTKPPPKPSFAPSAGFKISSTSTTDSGFGAPALGTPATNAPSFGNTGGGFTFVGAAAIQSGFGQPIALASTVTTQSEFGQVVGPPATATTQSGFGQPVAPAPNATAQSGFGQPAPASSAGFAQPVIPASTTAQSGAQAPKPVFNFTTATTTTATTGFTFGKPVTTMAVSSGPSTVSSSKSVSSQSSFSYSSTSLLTSRSNMFSSTSSKDTVTTQPAVCSATPTFSFGLPATSTSGRPVSITATLSRSIKAIRKLFPVTMKPAVFSTAPPTSSFGSPATSTPGKPFAISSSTSSTPASALLKGFASEKQAKSKMPEGKTFGGFTFTSTPLISDLKDAQKTVAATPTKPSDLLKGFASEKQAKSKMPEGKTFGGFTFMPTPLISDVKDAQKTVAATPTKPIAEKDKAQPPKTNIFANFTFTSPPKSMATTIAESTIKGNTTSVTSAGPVLGATTNLASFSDLAKSTGSANAFGKPGEGKGFGGAGQPVFKTAEASPKVVGGVNMEGEEADEEYEPDVDFKPVVPLPDLFEVKTGEEEEEKLFSHRARLYRHDSETKQWKERGVGELKILRHRETKRCRILMRREQVLKLCANHFITKDIKLSPLMSSDHAWCWFAQDFSEGEVSNDQLAVRFKTSEIAQEFKEVFEKCQNDSDSVAPASKPEVVVKCPGQMTLVELLKSDSEKEESASKPAGKGFGDLFKPKAGTWECQGCYVQNAADVVKCPACGTLKHGATDPEQEASAIKFGAGTNGGFTVQGSSTKSAAKGFSDVFKPKTGSWECHGCYVQNNADTIKCVACGTLKPGATEPAKEETAPTKFGAGARGGFTFQGRQVNNSTSASSTSGLGSAASSGFGTAPGGFTFGAQTGTATASATSTPTTTMATTPSGLTFSTPGSEFSFSMTPVGFGTSSKTSTTATPTATASASPSSSSSSLKYVFGQDTAFSFTPVTPQPALRTRQYSHGFEEKFKPLVHLQKVEVKTGEEEEDTLYCQRAKLYRYADGEWKERGTGDVKLLKHKQSGKVRILMRREKILKLCLNHLLTPDMVLRPMINSDGKAWVWFAMDCSEGDPTHEQLAIRFKNKEFASDFAEAFNSAKSGAHVTPVEPEKTENKQEKDKKDAQKSGETAKEFSFKSDSPNSTTKAVSGFKFTPPKLSTPATTQDASAPKTSFTFGSGFSQKSPSVFGGSSQSTPVSFSASPLSKGKNLLSLLEESQDIEITGEEKPTDVYFKPLVQLPEVEVKTGEEDEEIMYSHRAKLYRYTDGQWKERGVGDFKLLKHKQTGRIRLLMRREQIHKLCCNHSLTPDLVLKPMQTSETAWCWNAMDYTEPQGNYEHFALRFKTKEIAEKFKEKFEECQAMIPSSTDEVSTTEAPEETSRVEDASRVEEVDTSQEQETFETGEDYEDGGEDYGGEYEDDDEYEDEEPLFEKRATLQYLEGTTPIMVGMGELKIILDEDVNGARIQMAKDDGTRIINHIICRDHQIQCNETKKFCEWTAKDYSTDKGVKRTFGVTFSSNNTVVEFRTCFEHGKDLAQDSDIRECNKTKKVKPRKIQVHCVF